MFRRTLANRGTALVAGLIAGLAGQAASAADEVIAYGGAAAQQAREFDAAFQARMARHANAVDAAIRANVEREVTRIKAPTLQVALSDAAKRG